MRAKSGRFLKESIKDTTFPNKPFLVPAEMLKMVCLVEHVDDTRNEKQKECSDHQTQTKEKE